MHRYNFNALISDPQPDKEAVDYTSCLETHLARQTGTQEDLMKTVRDLVTGSKNAAPDIEKACVVIDNALWACLTDKDLDGLDDMRVLIKECIADIEKSQDYASYKKAMGVAMLNDALRESKDVELEIQHDLDLENEGYDR